MGGLTYLRAREALKNQVNIQLRANLNSLETNFNSWINTKQIRLDLAVRKPDIRATLDDIFSSSQSAISIGKETRERILAYLEEVAQRNEGMLFNQFFITTPDGLIIVSSQNDLEGRNISTTDFYKKLSTDPDSMAVYDQALLGKGDVTVITSVPYYDDQKILQGTIFGITGPISMIGLLEDVSRYNPTANSYLIFQSKDFIRVDPYQKLMTLDEPSSEQKTNLLPLFEKISLDQTTEKEIILSTSTFDETPVIASIKWLPSLKAALVVEIPEHIAFGELNRIGPYILALSLALSTSLVIAIWSTTQRLVGPLNLLTDSTQQFAQGNWDQRSSIKRKDEIGLLSQSFNQMADDLSRLYQSLETQVKERTSSLEKRSQQLEATAEVAREAAAIRNLNDLLAYITQLISEQFGFYHVGIFLIDDSRQYAILQATNSQGGQSMLGRGHKLEVGQTGVVGYVAATGLPRIALDVGSDAFFFDNPDLPDTRSELALPLKVRNIVIGVMDVQSTESSAFYESDIEVLQILADQIALAIDNTRLNEQSQEIIRELQNAYQSQTKISWSRQLRNQPITYHFDRVRITPVTDRHQQKINQLDTQLPQVHITEDGSYITVPLNLREQTIGSIILHRGSDENSWTPSDLSVVQDAMNQVTAALDNARLLEETKWTASREQMLGEITAKIRETMDLETIAKTATEEIRQALDLSEVSIHLGANSEDPNQGVR
jgi:GAF domain-containing protein/HAMP domain-containing protein